MNRLHIHWTGGSYTPNPHDLACYHFVIDGRGQVHKGKFPPEANLRPRPGRYAPHTLGANTGAIGVALAAMGGAVERPFSAGRWPITRAQVEALAAFCAKLARAYEIPITRQTVLTHAEVQPTLGIRQRAKWDVTWLPGMTRPGDPIEVGDRLRQLIASHP